MGIFVFPLIALAGLASLVLAIFSFKFFLGLKREKSDTLLYFSVGLLVSLFLTILPILTSGESDGRVAAFAPIFTLGFNTIGICVILTPILVLTKTSKDKRVKSLVFSVCLAPLFSLVFSLFFQNWLVKSVFGLKVYY